MFHALNPKIVSEDYTDDNDLSNRKIKKLLGGKSPDLFIMSPSCKGFSSLGKKNGLDHDESVFFVGSNNRRINLDPRTYVHEITSNMAPIYRMMLDVAHSLTPQDMVAFGFKSVEDYTNEELIEDTWKKLNAAGRLNRGYTLRNNLFSGMHNTHDYRINFPLNPRFLHHTDPNRYTKGGDGFLDQLPSNQNKRLFDANIVLNRDLEPGDDIYTIFTTDRDYNKEYSGPIKRFTAKNIINRPIANDSGAPSALITSYTKNRGGNPPVLRNISDEEMAKVLKGEIDPKQLYYAYDPYDKYSDVSHPNLVKVKDRITAQSDLIKPGGIYGIDRLTPQEMAVLMGWKAEAGDIIADEAKKRGVSEYRAASKVFGDAYPQQQMVYIMLHNPVLWEKFPDQMRKAVEKFKSIEPSDMRLKENFVPIGNFANAIKRKYE
jgi:hypothetical protein